MEELETMFQKINKENYDLRNHKNKLRVILQNHKYFRESQSGWDIKMIFTSLSFSALVLIMTVSFSPQTIYKSNYPQSSNATLYDRLVKNNNASASGNENLRIIEINQDNATTMLYFNNNKKLINSITNK